MPTVRRRRQPAEAGPDGKRLLKTPDVTPLQLASGVPVVAELLHVFGAYDLSAAQQDSLNKTVIWAVGIVGADSVVRAGRAIGNMVRTRT